MKFVPAIDTAGGLPTASLTPKPVQSNQALPFVDFLKDALQETNSLQLKAEEAAQQLATGQASDLHQVMIAMEKANLSFLLTLQVRNKVIDAYQEIMRMQI